MENTLSLTVITERFLGTKQNSSRIMVSEQNFEQNKRFLRALPNKPFYEQNLSKPTTWSLSTPFPTVLAS